MLNIDLLKTIEDDRERDLRTARWRQELREAKRAHAVRARGTSGSSGGATRVSVGDRTRELGNPVADVGGLQDLHPASGS
jgi:hypothetical protein